MKIFFSTLLSNLKRFTQRGDTPRLTTSRAYQQCANQVESAHLVCLRTSPCSLSMDEYITELQEILVNFSLLGFSEKKLGVEHRVPTPPPLPLRVGKAGRNNLSKEITPLLPTGIG